MPAITLADTGRITRAIINDINDEIGRIRAECACAFTEANAHTLILLSYIGYDVTAGRRGGLTIAINLPRTANAEIYGPDILDRLIAYVGRRLTRAGIPGPAVDRAEIRRTSDLSVSLVIE
jgi:hypothetical protein